MQAETGVYLASADFISILKARMSRLNAMNDQINIGRLLMKAFSSANEFSTELYVVDFFLGNRRNFPASESHSVFIKICPGMHAYSACQNHVFDLIVRNIHSFHVYFTWYSVEYMFMNTNKKRKK